MYYVQCSCGHTSCPLPGSQLEARCKEYAAEGHLDALPVSSDECEQCQCEHGMREQITDGVLGDWGL